MLSAEFFINPMGNIFSLSGLDFPHLFNFLILRRIIMSTRGLLGFKNNSLVKASYNHSDSYPTCLGYNVMSFIKNLSNQPLEVFKKNVSQLKWVDPDSKPTDNDITKYKRFCNTHVGRCTELDWYCLLREVQGAEALPAILDGTLDVWIDNTDFIKDSLFCEWAYFLDLESDILEIYKGFQSTPDPTNIFGTEFCKSYNDDKYYPCKLIYKIGFEKLKKYSDKQLESLVRKLEK